MKYYVGVKYDASREVFTASTTPTQSVYGDRYCYVIGPHKTLIGAKFMRDYGRNNPHCQTSDDADKLAQTMAW